MRKMRLRTLCLGIAGAGLCVLAFGASTFAQSASTTATIAVSDTLITDTYQSEPGVLVTAVEPSSPAAKAGLVRGDILLKVNDQPVNDLQALLAVIATAKPGASTTVSIQHGDVTRDLTLALGERRGRAFLGIVPLLTGPVGASIALARPTQPELPALPAVPESPLPVTSTVQVRVIEVIKASPADKAGLQAGDTIIGLNGKAFSPATDLAGQIQTFAPSDVITLEVQPGDQASTFERKVILGQQPGHAERAFLGVKVAPINIMIFKKQRMDAGQETYFTEALPAAPFGWWMPAQPYAMPPMMPYGYGFGQPGVTISSQDQTFLMPGAPGAPMGGQPFFYTMPAQPPQPPLAEPVQIELPDGPAL
ncbi:MAG: PDZ domain-containing protein [Chloroflexi bacterium]|nr:PDZ domain-containing protein [Chloroflexota bacterium]